tara:strand:+ start:159 stop:356 length:198 start_codon:yes stop_codon:yes gene_type:complete
VIIARSINEIGTVLIIDGVFRTKPDAVDQPPVVSVYPEPCDKAAFNVLFLDVPSASPVLLGEKAL